VVGLRGLGLLFSAVAVWGHSFSGWCVDCQVVVEGGGVGVRLGIAVAFVFVLGC